MSTPADPFGILIATLETGGGRPAERASRALRDAARDDAARLKPWRRHLLRLAIAAETLPVRWNLIVVLGLLPLTRPQAAVAVDWLLERLGDRSSLTRTVALQALFDLRPLSPGLAPRLCPVAEDFAATGTAAMRARATKLLSALRRTSAEQTGSGTTGPNHRRPGTTSGAIRKRRKSEQT